jgi:plastocyanin
MRRAVLVVVLAGALAAPAAAGSRTVALRDDVFAPAALTVAKGTTVTWAWRGKHKHDVAVATGPATFRSKRKRSGSFTQTLTRRGTYQLVCTTHAPDMQMTLTVR